VKGREIPVAGRAGEKYLAWAAVLQDIAAKLRIEEKAEFSSGTKQRRKGRSSMALSACRNCDWHLFEVVPSQPYGSPVKLYLVQCANCGAVVGAFDASLEGSLKDIQKRIQQIEQEIDYIQSRIRHV